MVALPKNRNPRGEDGEQTADEGRYEDSRMLTCLRRRIELLFAATLPRCETFGLEGLAARIIAERKLPLQDMESAMSAIQVAVASNDALKVIDSVQRFHLCILEKTGNPLLLDTGKRLIVPLLAFTRMRVQARNLDASPWVPEVSNHQRILDALRGSPETL